MQIHPNLRKGYKPERIYYDHHSVPNVHRASRKIGKRVDLYSYAVEMQDNCRKRNDDVNMPQTALLFDLQSRNRAIIQKAVVNIMEERETFNCAESQMRSVMPQAAQPATRAFISASDKAAI